MSYAINPERIEDEIISSYRYDTENDIDSFTLNRKRFQLEDIVKKGSFNENTFIALGLIYFHMKEYSKFIEIYRTAFKYFPGSLSLHAQRILGCFRMFNYNLYPVGDFDLYTEWFDDKINIEKYPLNFGFGSRKIIFTGKEVLRLVRHNNAYITLNHNRRFKFVFGPFEYTADYDEMNHNETYFDESFTWNVIDKIRKNEINKNERNYLKEILGDNYTKFIEIADPDYSQIVFGGNEAVEQVETFNTVDDLIASL
jgi:hypothetical protein